MSELMTEYDYTSTLDQPTNLTIQFKNCIVKTHRDLMCKDSQVVKNALSMDRTQTFFDFTNQPTTMNISPWAHECFFDLIYSKNKALDIECHQWCQLFELEHYLDTKVVGNQMRFQYPKNIRFRMWVGADPASAARILAELLLRQTPDIPNDLWSAFCNNNQKTIEFRKILSNQLNRPGINFNWDHLFEVALTESNINELIVCKPIF